MEEGGDGRVGGWEGGIEKIKGEEVKRLWGRGKRERDGGKNGDKEFREFLNPHMYVMALSIDIPIEFKTFILTSSEKPPFLSGELKHFTATTLPFHFALFTSPN